MPYLAKRMSDPNSATPKTTKNTFYYPKRMFYFNLKKLTFSWSKLTYLGKKGSDRKMDARFRFSGSGLPTKLHFLMKKNV